jgi:hypothetical protein
VSHEGSWDHAQGAHSARENCGHIDCKPFATGSSKEHRKEMMMGVKVFTATKARDREMLGDVITRWLQDNPRARVVDKIVTQSSDSQFHCLSITLFYSTDD